MGDEPAFPVSTVRPGMSLPDWFAGQALAGMLANGPGLKAIADLVENRGGDGGEYTACLAYQYADAMMTERSRRGLTLAKSEGEA